MKYIKKILIALLICLLCNDIFAVTVDRYGIFIGANDGGSGKEKLLYAGSDASTFMMTMTELGGVSVENSRLLLNPSKKNVDVVVDELSKKIEKNKSKDTRSELIFYYSGHSDETGLYLGNTFYDYSELKQTISSIPSDIHVVILDSCYSGNFVRTKGGAKKKPFLVDDSSVVKGHAYLSSSSEWESSQESDEIEASYFTNALISGLRGAADLSGDKKVTLNELYSYAFNETLSKTEDTKSGPQHPTYNITLVGTGDLVLSDFSSANSLIMISPEVQGRIILRDNNGKFISETNKTDNTSVLMAMDEGTYSVTVINGSTTERGSLRVSKNEIAVIKNAGLVEIERKSTVSRGAKSSESKHLHEKRMSMKEKFSMNEPLFRTGLPVDFSSQIYFGKDAVLGITNKNKIDINFDLRLSFFRMGFVSFTAINGLNTQVSINPEGTYRGHLGFNPGLGMHFWPNKPGSTGLDGFYLFLFPVYDISLIDVNTYENFLDDFDFMKFIDTTPKPYTIALETGFQGRLSIIEGGVYFRPKLTFNPVGNCDFSFDFGITLGFIIPGARVNYGKRK